mmetsp:Transcript_146752/g.365968  ORF Transcript_146752/g.365968 Transcript_146752/m.365968 type:complete len:1169 (-) Transcript_146752:49-3555(-)
MASDPGFTARSSAIRNNPQGRDGGESASPYSRPDRGAGQGRSSVAQEPGSAGGPLQKLKIWQKMQKGELHTITRENVQELYRVLDTEEKGEISKEDLLRLRDAPGLSLTENDIYALADDCDKDDSGQISVDELYTALTQGTLAFNLVKESLGKSAKTVDEKSLELTKVIKFLEVEYETSSALWSLPQTLTLFALFMILMSKHLDLTTAYRMQEALLNEIEGEGPPYLHNHEWAIVHDVPTLWQWMDSSFVSLHFKNADDELDTFPYPGRVASYNQIVGGVQLIKTQVASPEACMQSEILRSSYDTLTGGSCYRGPDTEQHSEFLFYHFGLDHIHERIHNLSQSHWVDQNTSYLDVNTLFYNAHLQAFTDCHLTFSFLASGLVKIVINMETFQADPYFVLGWGIPDVMFVFILVKMLYSELKELLPAARGGLDSLKNYFAFWNIVDWSSIIGGAVIMGYWAMVCRGVSFQLQPMMQDIPSNELDAMVMANRTYLNPGQVESVISQQEFEQMVGELHAVSNDIANLHLTLRDLVFWYAFILMMKFFKAFQANPRLDIVIRTLTMSAVEITHFMIVFSVIFLCFSSAGYVVFGKAVKGFRDQWQAIMMCWRILMGEFDIPEMEMVNYFYAHIWMVLFQFIVLCILLNMLLAIIMDTYVAAKSDAGEDQVTIWRQIKEACNTLRETQGHIPMYHLLVELQDEDYPAHPLPNVTLKSLRRAFQKMGRHQAEYIMRKTVDFIKAQTSDADLGLSDTVRILSLLKVNVLRNVHDTQQILELLTSGEKAAQAARFDAIMNDAEHASSTTMQGPGPFATLPGMVASGLSGAEARAVSKNTSTSLPGVGPRNTSKGHALGIPGSVSMNSSTIALGAAGQGPISNQGGGHARSGTEVAQLPPGSAEILAILGHIQADMQVMHEEQQRFVESVQEQLAEQRQYIEERDSWLEQRLSALERRCDKVQQGNEKVLGCVQGVDFTEIMNLPEKLEFLMPQRGKLSQGIGNHKDFVCQQFTDGEGEEGSAQPSNSGLPGTFAKKLKGQLEEISGHVQQLVSHAEETAEQRKLLWKIDNGIRQLRQQGLSPVRTATTASSKKGVSVAGGSDLGSSRQGSKQHLSGRRVSIDSNASARTGHPSLMGRLPEVPMSTGEVASSGSQRVATPPEYQSPPRPTDITADRG